MYELITDQRIEKLRNFSLESNALFYVSTNVENIEIQLSDISVIFLAQGSLALDKTDFTLRLSENEFVVLNRNTFETIQLQSNTSNQFLILHICKNNLYNSVQNIHIHAEFTKDLFLQYLISSELFVYKQNTKETKLGLALQHVANQIANKIEKKFNPSIEFYEQISRILLENQLDFFLELNRIVCVKNSTKHSLYAKLIEGKKFLVANADKNIKIQAIAQQAGMSEFHFFRLFKKVYLTTPQQLIIRTRLERAKKLLMKEQYSITEISKSLGFPDIHTFSKSYKKYFGISPSKFKPKFNDRNSI